ncbi:unannotated protein [freshwater metagenome]|uniref:Unannotated protein n=1 Tax=freshwater metagenome TaxID=449393 RepID=A0A6J6DAC9_9ZZZZ|nr:ATP-binding cassette domain-containing protein [Actinomycetota bacterium]
MPLLDVQGLVAGYAGARIVTGLDLAIEPGEVVALLGRNGAGKSTAVAAITGTLPAMAGSIAIGGADVTKAAPSRRFQLGMRTVRQDQPILRDLTVAENLRLVGASKEDAAEGFPFLAERSSQRAGTLSGGEQKMLAVARAAANPGLLWILDEPSEGLQPKNVDRCAQLIREAAARGVGVLLVEQHIGMALNVADRWLVMETGAVIDHGEVSATTHETVSRRLAV